MDIKEVKKLKKDLEEKIQKTLMQFTNKTGVIITSININAIRELYGDRLVEYLPRVVAEIE